MPETKTITVNICLPINVELEVSWEDDEAKIYSIELSTLGQMLSPQMICDHADEDTLEEIDHLTKEVFGITEEE